MLGKTCNDFRYEEKGATFNREKEIETEATAGAGRRSNVAGDGRTHHWGETGEPEITRNSIGGLRSDQNRDCAIGQFVLGDDRYAVFRNDGRLLGRDGNVHSAGHHFGNVVFLLKDSGPFKAIAYFSEPGCPLVLGLLARFCGRGRGRKHYTGGHLKRLNCKNSNSSPLWHPPTFRYKHGSNRHGHRFAIDVLIATDSERISPKRRQSAFQRFALYWCKRPSRSLPLNSIDQLVDGFFGIAKLFLHFFGIAIVEPLQCPVEREAKKSSGRRQNPQLPSVRIVVFQNGAYEIGRSSNNRCHHSKYTDDYSCNSQKRGAV